MENLLSLKKSFFLNNIKNNTLKDENIDILKKTNKKENNNIKGSIEWDYDSDLSIYWKVNNLKKINIYLVNNFNINENPRYIKTIKNCVQLFDSNDYPIVLLNILNKGGLIYNAQLLLELLSPKTTINIYGAFRNNGILNNDQIFIKEILPLFSDSENCEIANETLMKKTNKIDYGNKVEDILSGTVILMGKNLEKK